MGSEMCIRDRSLEMPGGRRKRGAHTNAYYNSTRHLAPKDVHCPSPRHDHSKRPKGLGNKGATKYSPEHSHIPKSCCLVSIVAKYSSAGAALAKSQQRPKRCCRTTGVTNNRSTGAARVSSPQDPPSKAHETCLCREKRELGVVSAVREPMPLKELRPPLHAGLRVPTFSPSLNPRNGSPIGRCPRYGAPRVLPEAGVPCAAHATS